MRIYNFCRPSESRQINRPLKCIYINILYNAKRRRYCCPAAIDIINIYYIKKLFFFCSSEMYTLFKMCGMLLRTTQ